MIQSGTLYTIDTSTGAATNVPIKGARILFKQGNTIRAQTTTNATTGAYSVDVPLGKYTVELAAGSTTSIVRAGQEFELTSSGNASTFQNWLYSKSGDINDQLLKSFKDIMDATIKAKDDTIIAKNEIVGNSVGSGKFLKEGAYGISTPSNISNVNPDDYWGGLNHVHMGSIATEAISGTIRYAALISVNLAASSFRSQLQISRDRMWIRSQESGWKKFYTESNTAIDSNGFLKRASPIIKISSKGAEWSGFNEDPIFEHIGVGVYKISNTLGLADGNENGDWYIELPKDRYGDHYFNANLERLSDGVIIRIYERKELYFPSEMSFPDRDGNLVYAQEKIVVNGNQIDLKEEWRFISLRFKEPEIIEEVEDELYSQSDNLA